MTRLNQIVAIEKGVKNEKDKIWTAAYQLFDQNARFQGTIRTYKPLDDDGVELPEERQLVQTTVPNLVETVQTALTRMFDVVTTKDNGNTEARADIKIGEAVLAPQVPVTTLLWLEKQLVDLHTFATKMPTLDPSKSWEYNIQLGQFQAEAIVTMKSNKALANHILYEATPEHPAQVQTFQTDEPVGKWTTMHFSGAIPQAVKDQVVERISAVQEAVKFAREEANGITITDQAIGTNLLDYMFEPIEHLAN